VISGPIAEVDFPEFSEAILVDRKPQGASQLSSSQVTVDRMTKLSHKWRRVTKKVALSRKFVQNAAIKD